MSLTCENVARAYVYFDEIDPAREVKVPGVNRPGLAAVSDIPPARDITVGEAEWREKNPDAD
jgi:hypothetical protein